MTGNSKGLARESKASNGIARVGLSAITAAASAIKGRSGFALTHAKSNGVAKGYANAVALYVMLKRWGLFPAVIASVNQEDGEGRCMEAIAGDARRTEACSTVTFGQ